MNQNNNSVHHAIDGLLYGFKEYNGTGGHSKSAGSIYQIFVTPNASFDEKVAKLDAWVDAHPACEPLREYLFDLLMTHFIREEGTSEAFFNSKEWDRIEEEYADRGSELLDVITYIDECHEVEVIPSIEDFIYEYLLMEDDPDKETMTLYEPLIRHKALVDEILEDIIEETVHEDDNTLGPLLQALLIYFSEPAEPEGVPVALNDIGGSSAETSALTCCILFYDRGIDGASL